MRFPKWTLKRAMIALVLYVVSFAVAFVVGRIIRMRRDEIRLQCELDLIEMQMQLQARAQEKKNK